ncbi:MAG: T9SS type A sorting domain-containing protein [Flavihumibacter sp.]
MRRLVHLCWVFLLMPVCSFAADKYWRATGSGDWNNTSSWSDTQGGPTGAAVPGADDVAIFLGGTSGGSGTVLINAPVTIQKIDIRANFAGTIEVNAAVHLTGDDNNQSFAFVGANAAITTVVNLNAPLTCDALYNQTRGTVNAISPQVHMFNGIFRLGATNASIPSYFHLGDGAEAYFGSSMQLRTLSNFDGQDGSKVYFQKLATVTGTTNIEVATDATNGSSFYDVVFDNELNGASNVIVTFNSYTMIVRHNVQLESGRLNGNGTGGLVIGGDLTSSGMLSGVSGATFEFNGTGDQIIDLSGTDLDKLDGTFTINKPAGKLTLASEIRLDAYQQQMVFINGIVYSSPSNLITFGATAIVTGFSNASHVDGPVQKLGNPAFTFPVGKDGVLGAVRLSGEDVAGTGGIDDPYPTTSPDGQARYRVEYFRKNPAQDNLYPDKFTAPLTNVSECEYWSVVKVAGNAKKNPRIWLSYDSARSCGISDPSQLRVANLVTTTPSWVDRGNTLETNGGINFIGTSAVQTNFPFFTLASTDLNLNPLPVNWLNFSGRYFEGKVDLNWETAMEKDNAVFTVERAAGGHSFEAIGTVAGRGTTSLRGSYSFTDNNPLDGDNSYRIKQTDIDGTFSYSNVIRVVAANGMAAGLRLYPNPVITTQQITLENTTLRNKKVSLSIVNAAGVVIRQEQVTFGNDSRLKLNTSNLKKGSYFIRITDGDKKLVSPVVVQ